MKQELPKFNWTFHHLELFYRAVAGCGPACFSFASLLPQVGLLHFLKPSPNKVGKVLKLEVKPVTFWAFQGSWRRRGVTTWAAIAGGAKRQKLRGMLAKGLQSWSIPIRFFISLLKYFKRSQWLKKNCVQRTDDDEKRKNLRIVGGCAAGHTPWFVFLSITGGWLRKLSLFVSSVLQLI